jgi:hypothetical protein
MLSRETTASVVDVFVVFFRFLSSRYVRLEILHLVNPGSPDGGPPMTFPSNSTRDAPPGVA